MMPNESHNNYRLAPGTFVVSSEDGESGRIEGICSYRRNGIDARSYVVQTSYGREIWGAGDLFTPEREESDSRASEPANRFDGCVHERANAEFGLNRDNEAVFRIVLNYDRGPRGVENVVVVSRDAAIALRDALHRQIRRTT